MVNIPPKSPKPYWRGIVLVCSKENDLVLDPFCGSGTTGVAALKNNRKFVGIDSEKDYLDKIAIPRIKDVLNQGNLSPFKEKGEMSVSENEEEYGLLP